MVHIDANDHQVFLLCVLEEYMCVYEFRVHGAIVNSNPYAWGEVGGGKLFGTVKNVSETDSA